MNIPSHYLALITAHLPGIDATRLQANTDGLVNDVFIADTRWVFRFPKHAVGRADLIREHALLEFIRPRLGMAVPAFELLGNVGAVYPMIPGVPLYRHELLRLSEAAQDAFAAQLGDFLRRLHSITGLELSEHGLGAPLPAVSRDEWLARFAAAEAALHPYLWTDQKAWMADLFAPVRDGRLDLDFTPVLIHNDLAPYHILTTSTSSPHMAGVIDFGVAGAGDPAADFAALITTYGESCVVRMAQTYPGLDALLDRARLRAGYLEIEWVLKGLANNDASWYSVHIGRARDMLPIGR